LAKGLLPSTLRASAIAAGELATYDIAKTALRAWLVARDGGGGGEGAALHVAASLITGAVAAVVAAPFDLIKSRAMASSQGSETLRSVVRALAREGNFPLSLFRGVLPAYLRLGPHALICFPLLEQLRRALSLDYI
jgi:dicarboxylate transporter 10